MLENNFDSMEGEASDPGKGPSSRPNFAFDETPDKNDFTDVSETKRGLKGKLTRNAKPMPEETVKIDFHGTAGR